MVLEFLRYAKHSYEQGDVAKIIDREMKAAHRIRVWSVAYDGGGLGTCAECFTSRAAVYGYLIERLFDEEEPMYKEAETLLDHERFDELEAFLQENSEPQSATWQIFPAEFNVSQLEVVDAASAPAVNAKDELIRALEDLVKNLRTDLHGYWTESTDNLVQAADAAIIKARASR